MKCDEGEDGLGDERGESNMWIKVIILRPCPLQVQK